MCLKYLAHCPPHSTKREEFFSFFSPLTEALIPLTSLLSRKRIPTRTLKMKSFSTVALVALLTTFAVASPASGDMTNQLVPRGCGSVNGNCDQNGCEGTYDQAPYCTAVSTRPFLSLSLSLSLSSVSLGRRFQHSKAKYGLYYKKGPYAGCPCGWGCGPTVGSCNANGCQGVGNRCTAAYKGCSCTVSSCD